AGAVAPGREHRGAGRRRRQGRRARAHHAPQRRREHPLRQVGDHGRRAGRGGLPGPVRRQGGVAVPRDLGYINARVRGMKSKLLGPSFTQAALEGTDFRAFLSTLTQSPYMREVEEAQARYDGLAVVDSAVARNFYGTARSLLSFSDGKPRELIGLLLLRYDLANIKAIARGKHAGKAADEIRGSLCPAGELKPALLEEAAAAADIASAAQVIAFSKNELGRAFLKAARRYQDDKDLYALELALDKAYFEALSSRADAVGAPAELKRHFQREIDATNLLTALKLRGRGVDRDLFVPGGKEVP